MFSFKLNRPFRINIFGSYVLHKENIKLYLFIFIITPYDCSTNVYYYRFIQITNTQSLLNIRMENNYK